MKMFQFAHHFGTMSAKLWIRYRDIENKFTNVKKMCKEICHIERKSEISELSLDILNSTSGEDFNRFQLEAISDKCELLLTKIQVILDTFEDIDRVRNLSNLVDRFANAFYKDRLLNLEKTVRVHRSVNKAKNKLLLCDFLQEPSDDNSYLLSRLKDTCHFIFKPLGGINLSKNEMTILALNLLEEEWISSTVRFRYDLDELFRMKCKLVCKMLENIFKHLNRLAVRRKESWKNACLDSVAAGGTTVDKMFMIIRNLRERILLEPILCRLRNVCLQICDIDGGLGIIACELISYIDDKQFADTKCVIERCEKLCKDYGIFLSSLKKINNARRIIYVGSEFVDTYANLSIVILSSDKGFADITAELSESGTLISARFEEIFEVVLQIILSLNWISEELQEVKEKLKSYIAALYLSLLRISLALIFVIRTQVVFLEEIKHGTSLKVTRLVLYNCGDIERNPGPVLRDFRKFYQTPLLYMIYKKMHIEPPPPNSLYTKGPPFFWNQYPGVTDAKFFNIPNVAKHNKEKGTCFKEEDCKNCFQRIIDILRHVMKEEMPDNLGKILRYYEDLMTRKRGRKEKKEYYEQCEKEIEVWVLKKQRAKPQKDLSESNSELELCLEQKFKSVEAGIGTVSAKEKELMQKLICFTPSQNNIIGERKRRHNEISNENNTPSNSKYSRQEPDPPYFDETTFPDVDSDLSPRSALPKQTSSFISEDQSGTSIPYDNCEEVLENFVYKLCQDLID